MKKIKTRETRVLVSFGGVGESCTRVQRRPHNDVYSLDDINNLTRHRIS